MLELDILRTLASKENFDRFRQYITKGAVSKEVWQILEDMREFLDSKDHVEWDDFRLWFFVSKHSTLSKERGKIYEAIFDKLELNPDPSEESAEIINHLITRDYADRILAEAGKVSEGRSADLTVVKGLYDDFEKELDMSASVDTKFVSDDLEVLSTALSAGTGLNWRLDELNKSLGPLRKGDLIVICARPDAGKTTMLASEVTYMAPQMADDQHVIWFNNEEQGQKVQYRVIQSALGMDRATIEGAISSAKLEYEKKMGRRDRIKVYDNAVMSMREIENVLKYSYNAGLIVFDQLWKVKGTRSSGSDAERLTELFGWAREIAKQYGPVLCVHQADAAAEGQLFFEQDRLYGSKTGIQGEADVILTLGKSHEHGYEKVRGLYAPKNKMSGADPAYRNYKWEVVIEPEIGRFKSP